MCPRFPWNVLNHIHKFFIAMKLIYNLFKRSKSRWINFFFFLIGLSCCGLIIRNHFFKLLILFYFLFQIVFPKSDAQRKRLADSVQNILLFRSLDKVHKLWLCFSFKLNFFLFFLKIVMHEFALEVFDFDFWLSSMH